VPSLCDGIDASLLVACSAHLFFEGTQGTLCIPVGVKEHAYGTCGILHAHSPQGQSVSASGGETEMLQTRVETTAVVLLVLLAHHRPWIVSTAAF